MSEHQNRRRDEVVAGQHAGQIKFHSPPRGVYGAFLWLAKAFSPDAFVPSWRYTTRTPKLNSFLDFVPQSIIKMSIPN